MFTTAPKSFASITAGLSKMLTDLDAFATAEVANAEKKDAEARALMSQSQAHIDEAAKARSTAGKLGELLS